MIIKANSQHLNDILKIETSCFPNPWSRQSFINEINNEVSSNWVYVLNSNLVGYLFGWHIGDEFQINNIATHEKFRRLGIAKKMINNIISKLVLKDIFLEVSKSNSSAILLYEKLGFKKNGRREKYYSDNSDAVLYKMEIK